MRIIYNRFIPFKGFTACNLFGVIFVRRACADEVDIRVLRHEIIHTLQMRELWYVGFYVLYAVFYLVNLVRYAGDGMLAYRNIPFEREAYSHQDDYMYRFHRPKFNWRKRYEKE